MRCEELARRISQSAESALNPAAESELAEHLQSCPECQRRLEAWRQAEGVLAGAALAAPPPGFAQRTMRAVAAERVRMATAPNQAQRSPRIAVAALAVALLVVLAGALIIGASLAWNPEALSRLAAQSLILYVVQFLGVLVSVDAVIRAAAVLWGTLPAPAGAAVLCGPGLGGFAAVTGWAWLVTRYGWASRQATSS